MLINPIFIYIHGGITGTPLGILKFVPRFCKAGSIADDPGTTNVLQKVLGTVLKYLKVRFHYHLYQMPTVTAIDYYTKLL